MSAAVETRTDLQELAEFVVARALLAGASDAEVTIREGDEFSTTVRLGEVETLKESGSRGIGLRVLTEAENGYRVASTSSSDFTPEGIEHLVNGAVALAHVTSVDAFAGLADAAEFGKLGGDLELYHEDVYSLPIEERIAWARRAEAAAMAADTRLVNSDGASFDAATGRTGLCQFARIHGRVPVIVLLRCDEPDCPGRERGDAARLLVVAGAGVSGSGAAGGGGAGGGAADIADARCQASGYAAGPGGVCAGSGAGTGGSGLRRGGWRCDLSRCVDFCGEAGRSRLRRLR